MHMNLVALLITCIFTFCMQSLSLVNFVLSVENQWKFFKKGSSSGNIFPEYFDIFSHYFIHWMISEHQMNLHCSINKSSVVTQAMASSMTCLRNPQLLKNIHTSAYFSAGS